MREMVKNVKKEPKGNQFLLARRFRQDYGDKVEVAQTGEVSLVVKVVEVDERDAGGAPTEAAPETG